MRSNGKITTWHDEKGYGFVTPQVSRKRVFIHIKAFSKRGQRRPKLHDTISFSISKDERGRPCASKVVFVDQGKQRLRVISMKRITRSLPFAFMALVVLAVLLGRLPYGVLAVYLAVSGITFGIYALDKSAAKSGSWRTRENTLHILALSGGWPGALIAQHTLRHKSKKSTFRFMFWLTVMLNAGILIWLLTPSGENALQWVTQAVS